MRNTSRKWIYLLAACVAVSFNVGTAGAESPASSGIGMKLGQHGASLAGYRRYHDYSDVDEFDDPSAGYYAPPVYRYVRPPEPYFDTRVYELIPPPRPANCGEYRYWNGEYCADARDHPPYVGPRW